MKTLKKLLFAALATIGFSYAAQAAVEGEATASALPDGYAPLEYVTIPSGSYVNTDLKWQKNLAIDTEFIWRSFGGTYGAVFGAGSTDRALAYASYSAASGTGDWKGGGQLFSGISEKATTGVKYHVVESFDGTKFTLSLNGGEAKTSANAISTAATTYDKNACYLGQYTTSASSAKRKTDLYYAKIYTNLTVIAHDYVPAYDLSKNKYGVYDLQNGKFSVSGSSTVLVGPAPQVKFTIAGLNFDGIAPACGEYYYDYTKTKSVECTVPESVDLAGVEIVCKGWVLTDANGEVIRTSENLAEGESNFKAIVSLNKYGQTLTWQWPAMDVVNVSLVAAQHATFAATVNEAEFTGGSLMQDTEITVTATPAEHYQYDATKVGDWTWQPDGTITKTFTVVGDENDEMTIAIPEADPILVLVSVAQFANAEVTIWVGDEQIQNGEQVIEGAIVKVVVTPAIGYEYAEIPEGWARKDNTLAIIREFTAGEDSSDILIPEVTQAFYNFTLTPNLRGSVEADKENGEYGSGQTITLTATANEGFYFAGWLVNGEKTGWLQSEFSIVLDADKAVEPVFYRIDPTFGYDYTVDGDEVVVCTNVAKVGTFTVPHAVHALEYLVVGGGGSGGGGNRCGGGGAGGLVTNTVDVAEGNSFAIKVGAGGATASGKGNDGNPSTLSCGSLDFLITGLGGGGGASSGNGSAGGSGGGCAGYHTTASARTGGAAKQPDEACGGLGSDGGGMAAATSNRGGAGGGGAGGEGDNSTSGSGANGGLGVESMITGEAKYYAAGGGGGGTSGGGAGGSGIGGKGSKGGSGSAGSPSTGSGGGGAGNTGSYTGGKGGDGVVILRYVLPISRTNVLVTTEDGTLYGAPTPDYGEYEVGAYTTFAAPEYAIVDDTTRAYCLGWSAQDAWGEPWIEFTPGYSATITDEVPFALVWRWEVRRQVAATATEGGSVSGLDYFASGAEVELKATAESGYRFVAWENAPDGAEQQVDGTLTFTMGEEAVTALNAVFEAEVSSGVVVSFEGGNYGSPSPGYGTYTDYADGVERTYTNDEYAEISEGVRAYCTGYKVLDSDGQQLAAGTETSFKWTCAAGSHHTIVWIWEVRYLVTATAGEGGSVTGTGYYAAGEEVATVTATANGGYAFDGWAGDVPEGEENTNPLKLTVVDAPLAVSASFRQIPWGIALDYNKLNLPDVEQVSTNREACAVGETYTFKVPILIEKTAGAVRQRVIGYTVRTISEAGDGEETFYEGEVEDETNLVATIAYAEPVKVTWQWENDYYLTAGVNEGAMGSLVEDVSGWYANNSEVTVAIKDAKYFLSWSGDIAKADRAKQSVTLKITKAMRATAIFMTDRKDNVIANGDFEDMTGTTAVYKNFDSLLSGFWSGNKGTEDRYDGSGVLTDSSGDGWKAGKIEGKATAWLGNNGSSAKNSIWTDFTVYEKGEYQLSYQVKRERTDSYAAKSYDVVVWLCDASGTELQKLDTVNISGTKLYTCTPEQGVSLKKGKYRLKFTTNNAVKDTNGSEVVLAVDNVSLKLKYSQGLAFMFY